jgi:hypothetical protein
MELFPKDPVLKLNTKKLGNSPSFLTITHMTLSAKRFRSHKILTIDIAAEFCFWTEQQQNGNSISSLGLADTPKVSHIVSVDNSQLSNGPFNGPKRLAICKLRQSETLLIAETTILGRLHHPVNQVFNEISPLPPVTPEKVTR